MNYADFNTAKDFLALDTKENKVKKILDRVSLFMGDLSDLLFENGEFVKPKTIHLLRWWKIAQKTIDFIKDIVAIYKEREGKFQ